MTATYLLITYAVPLSIYLRIVSCAILFFFIIPLQVKEAGVHNGLRLLRFQLLAFGLILFFINFISIAFLISIGHVVQQPLNSALQIVNALAFLLLAIIGLSIYSTQYSEENKVNHMILEKEERKAKSKK